MQPRLVDDADPARAEQLLIGVARRSPRNHDDALGEDGIDRPRRLDGVRRVLAAAPELALAQSTMPGQQLLTFAKCGFRPSRSPVPEEGDHPEA